MTTFSSAIPSDPAYVFSTVTPKFLTARFVYNFFEIDEFDADPYEKDDPENGQNPREIVLNFDKAANLHDDNALGETAIQYYADEILAQFASKITSETLIQANGYIKYTSDTTREYSYMLTDPAGAGEPVPKLDAFFENASVSGEKRDGSVFASIDADQTLYLNSSTNRPTSEAAAIFAEQANESLLAADFSFDLIEASSVNPFNIHGKKNSEELDELKLQQVKTRRQINPLLASMENYTIFVDQLELGSNTELFNLAGMGTVGYVIFKKEIDPITNEGGPGDNKGCILIRDLDQTEYIDNKVRYGAKYQYNIHPLILVKPAAGSDFCFLLAGSRGRSCRINAVENTPPPPVEAIKFTYLGNGDMNLNWTPPTQYGNIPTRVIGDIKGYQIFIRRSVHESFQLFRHIDFNDMIGRERFTIPEDIPGHLMTFRKHHVTHYKMNIERDTEYIIAMCTIDAHGNSSNLSPQYRCRLNSATNSLTIGFASFKGAPKQYPNMMMTKKIFVDSIKVTNKKKLTVYWAPKATHISFSDSGDLDHVLATAPPFKTNPAPTDPENSPAYRIQLINITKQRDKVIDIFLQE